MQENSKNFNNYVEQERSKDSSVRIIRKEDLQLKNDTKCKHASLRLETDDDMFDFLVCNNPNCGMSWPTVKGGWNKIISKGEKNGR